jgi:ABC-type branched-subunit amino acid transport system substrate-binding protein
LVQVMKRKRIAVLLQDDDFGREGLFGVDTELRVQGSTLAATAITRSTDTDLDEAARKITEVSPDAVVLFCGPRQAKFFVQALHKRGIRPQIATSFALSAPIVLKAGGDEWEGVITAMAATDPLSDDPAAVRFRSILAKHGDGMPPSGFTLTGFRLAMPFVEALHRAGRDLTRATFTSALETFDRYEGGGPYWGGEGLLGPVHFRGGRRHGHDRVFLARAVKGRWQQISDWTGLED